MTQPAHGHVEPQLGLCNRPVGKRALVQVNDLGGLPQDHDRSDELADRNEAQ